MSKNKVIIFDWDGTLVHTLPAWLAGVKETLDQFGISYGDDKKIVDTIFSHGEAVFDLGLPEDDYEKYWETLRGNFQKNLGKITFHEGAIELLEKLKDEGYQLAIFTRSKRDTLEKMFEVLNFVP